MLVLQPVKCDGGNDQSIMRKQSNIENNRPQTSVFGWVVAMSSFYFPKPAGTITAPLSLCVPGSPVTLGPCINCLGSLYQ